MMAKLKNEMLEINDTTLTLFKLIEKIEGEEETMAKF